MIFGDPDIMPWTRSLLESCNTHAMSGGDIRLAPQKISFSSVVQAGLKHDTLIQVLATKIRGTRHLTQLEDSPALRFKG